MLESTGILAVDVMMENRNEYIIIGMFVLVIISLIINFVSAEINTSNPAYIEVLNKLNEIEWAEVIIGVTSENIREEVIASLSEGEFKLEGRSLLGLSFSGEITKEGLDKLVNNPNIRWVNLKIPLTPGLSQSVPLINATKVWNLNYSGRGITVCIIDTGVNASHPDLQGKVIIDFYNCSIIKVSSLGTYRLKIPDNKTVLEMVRLFKSDQKVEEATLLFITTASTS